MPRAWLAYWRLDEIQLAINRQELRYASSNQLKRVLPGDTVWIVTVDSSRGLLTIGPLSVSAKTSSREAVRRRLGTVKWPGRWYVFAAPRTTTTPQRVSLQGVVKRLTLQSSLHPRLASTSRAKLAQQLQTMRCLTPDAAKLINTTWERGRVSGEDVFERAALKVAAGDKLVVGRARREQSKLRRFLLDGSEQGECLMCGRILPADLLVAAHIIPRTKSTRAQKGSSDNVALMCSLGCDSLFEEGYIEVKRGLIREQAHHDFSSVRSALVPLVGRRVAAPGSKREEYFRRAARFR